MMWNQLINDNTIENMAIIIMFRNLPCDGDTSNTHLFPSSNSVLAWVRASKIRFDKNR
jgi:hypothetical protein